MMVNVAGVIVIRKDGAVLLQHRDDTPGVFYPDHWCYPGGVVEKDENFEEAARRELFEETGYKAEVLHPLNVSPYARTDGVTMNPHPFWTLFDEKQEIVCREGKEIVFVHSTDLAGKKFIPTQENLIKEALQAAGIN